MYGNIFSMAAEDSAEKARMIPLQLDLASLGKSSDERRFGKV